MAPTQGRRACLTSLEHTPPGRRTGPSVFVGARAPRPRVASGCHVRTLSLALDLHSHRLGHRVPGAVDVSRSGSRPRGPPSLLFQFPYFACLLPSSWFGLPSASFNTLYFRVPGAVFVCCSSRAHSVSAVPDPHSPVAPAGIHMHTRAHIFFSQTEIPVSGVLQCWILALHVSVPVFRVQGRVVQSRASKSQVAHSKFLFCRVRGGGGGRGSNVSDGYNDSDSVSA